MVDYSKVRVKLTDSQLKKLKKKERDFGTGVILWVSLNF